MLYLRDGKEAEPKTETIKYKIAPTRVFDLVIITAIYIEYEQVIKLLANGFIPRFQDPSRTTYFQGDLKIKTDKVIKVLVACANQMGMTSASALASKMIYRFTPRVVAMCGIAAGVNGEVGDIMIPDILWDYGSGKSTLETKKIFKLFPKDIDVFTPYRFPITIKQDLIGHLIRLTKETDMNKNIFQLGEEITYENKSSNLKTHIGPFVSGSAVIANDKILAQIKGQDGKLVGFDMEAFAIAYACEVADITPKPIAFIAKSISDFGNKKKSHQDKDKHQEYSAFTSANFLFLLIQRHPELFDLIETPSD